MNTKLFRTAVVTKKSKVCFYLRTNYNRGIAQNSTAVLFCNSNSTVFSDKKTESCLFSYLYKNFSFKIHEFDASGIVWLNLKVGELELSSNNINCIQILLLRGLELLGKQKACSCLFCLLSR